MKVLPTARILIIDSITERRETTRVGLSALGVGAVTELSSVTELEPGSRNYDVLVMQADDAENVPENPFRDGADAIPAVLVVDGPTHLLARVASRAGYDAAVGMPLLPRLLYRRIGSVLQRARRLSKPVAGATAAVAEEVQPVTAAN
ncbi:hypothetical protein GCM10007301_36160 [Azorhizobium oxalatiphilum]|uniref:Uncharacterized protein n=1 Tax=Azorhizobium oxalatiphilum TaxID=980631 RepID=A0A917C5H0_9HYPH|nr:hypothetical protein [Azorhizobium oxalatiphilum]GGF73106.1 hypothetical protein GCM10007301_36160 [Azorhizobium oxalatiphilum]